MKKLILISAILSALIISSGCTDSTEKGSVIYYDQTQNTIEEKTEPVKDETTELIIEAETETLIESETEQMTEVELVEEPKSAEHRTGDEIIGVSDKSLKDDDIYILYEDSVRNDTTGKWRLAKTSDDIDITEYALSYYKEYFKSDDEVHAFINFTQNTTTNITCTSGLLFVTMYEHVDKEEHDANLLFSGQMLSSYIIYIDNGDIEKI